MENKETDWLSARVPVALKDALRVAAAKNRHGLSKEIILRLERDLARDGAEDRGAAA